jgi:hypothetical protein
MQGRPKEREQKDKKILDRQFNRTDNRNNEFSTREGGRARNF